MFDPNVNRRALDLPFWLDGTLPPALPPRPVVKVVKKAEKERLFKRINRRQAW
ncbi:MAG TPA: hypothetical protein V6D47_07235 [Oscillatoriaceae cyanobacterium]